MAYSQKFNPDALPAHIEPDKAAELLANAHRPSPQAQQHTHHHHHNHEQRPPPPPKSSAPATGIPSRKTPPTGTLPHPASHSYGSRPPNAGAPTNLRPLADDHASRFHSPPPPNYGHGPRPNPNVLGRPPQHPLPPSSPAANGPPLAGPTSDDPHQLLPLFRAANVSRTGALTEAELGSALVNGDYSAFDPNTVKTMVRMFDRNGNGVIGFDEFVSLWRFLAAWREIFDRFDEDRSGRISFDEFEKALVAFGYRLSRTFIRVLFTAFESKGRRRAVSVTTPYPAQQPQRGMSFDLFVQACISLKRMTEVFKRYDDDRDGYITVSFEEFLTEFLQLQE
ncbi:hypothetical protein UA08_08044 [Talaromyces atroroseus]|uniref:EF-hand domain-containing protein n=1 Tax=Talaromyces atroroseus TaxID=1441469 RepID=A0A225AFP3_TALAT|nr:hypothetical protein UA08_08044 [Talaromyces atroroseus]OKL56894.1 hypothetical protein UA08_08044 [Talaromyces atroroseus]